ncbi:hypothetical protein V4F39_19255 [Aquincola sp. MAHUQ-54]|uniref:2-oxoadipate dioxygenase/decarboxylase n=1 Tax=Aquincola agrisoli TaxID=3119538 RepID=A0AAW9Q8D7_9BURK
MSAAARPARHAEALERAFRAFPDSHEQLRAQGLAYYRYFPTARGRAAAGILQSNLGDVRPPHAGAPSSREVFKQSLGRRTIDEMALYADAQRRSLADCAAARATKIACSGPP